MTRCFLLLAMIATACGGSDGVRMVWHEPTARTEPSPERPWVTRDSQMLIMQVRSPSFYGLSFASPDQAFHIQFSMLHLSAFPWMNGRGSRRLQAIDDGSVREGVWMSVLQPRVLLDLQRFLDEGYIGIALTDPTSGRTMLRACPHDLLMAGYINPDGERLVLLDVTVQEDTDPRYGCIYRLTRRPP